MSYCIVSSKDLQGEYRTEIAAIPINKGDRVILTHSLTIGGEGKTQSAFIVTQDQGCGRYANTINFNTALVAFNARLKVAIIDKIALAKDVDELRDNIHGEREAPKCLHHRTQ